MQNVAAFKARIARVLPNIEAEARAYLEAEAVRITAVMRALAPKDSGALAASIGWTWGAAPEGSMVLGTVAASPRAGLKITIYAGNAATMVTNARGARFQNARLQEFGTKTRPASPYFFPVWRANKARVKSGLTRAIRRGLAKS